MNQPNILYVMTDQQRFDTIAALGNPDVYTPNLDRLVRRGISFTTAYSTCPVCVPARYTIRTGREPPALRIFSNRHSAPLAGQADTIEGRCGPYLPRMLQRRGYRTFGIGKFHTRPWDEDLGYEVHLHSEELYSTPDQRRRDAYARWIAEQHPAFAYVEGLMGERTEMYYMPQISPMPAETTVERWAADRAVEQLRVADERPYYGFVSFVGPHPPFAPPVPYNRLYDPDRMPNPLRGDLDTDHMDEQIPWMNRLIWADEINDAQARVLRARYYGEITYIDDCLGRILDAVEARGDAEDTLICFFADHGDHLGDHHAWQKESFFEASCHIPFLLSWPARLPADVRREDLVCLTDLYGIAAHASRASAGGVRDTSGTVETRDSVDSRDGVDVLGVLKGSAAGREYVTGMYGEPGTPQFKAMIRDQRWKYIYLANGAREQLFDLLDDPHELANRIDDKPEIVRAMRERAIAACESPGAADALDQGRLRAFPFRARQATRIYQFDRSRGVTGFPERPQDVLDAWESTVQAR